MNHTVITGGPSTGKTTLIRHLRERGHHVANETAADLIRRHFDGEKIPVPWEDFDGFEIAVHREQRKRENSAPAGAFLDRSLVDLIVYCEAYGAPLPPGLMDDILGREYGPVNVLNRLPIFASEKYRSEQDTEGYRIGSFFGPVYTRLGFTVYEVPAFIGEGATDAERLEDAVRKRADFILANRQHENGKEIEIKARTKDIDRVRRTLGSYRGSLEFVTENDRYIPVREGSHRIRERVHEDGRVEYVETVKGPKEEGALTIRREDERLVDATAFQNAPYDLEVRKKREIFRPRFSPGLIVTIDDVDGLGQFVEVEGKTRHAVNQWAGQLLLPPMLWVPESYEKLAREKAA
jgi:predicted ATPase/adenylate cyclase class IV